MPRATLLLLALVALLAAAATADAHALRSLVKAPKMSAYKNGRYQAVGSDGDYTYYRFAISLAITSFAAEDANPATPALNTIAFSADAKDFTTGAVVGHVDAYTVVTGPGTTVPSTLSTLYHFLLELGPMQGDSISVSGGYEFDGNPANPFLDHDLPIVGGTGQFKGATGEVAVGAAGQGTLTVWVPRLKDF